MDPVDSVLVEGRGITHTNDEADGSPVSHNEETVDAVLAHYGTKGMKWGVRNDRGHEGERVKNSKLDKLDKKWEQEHIGQRAWLKAYNSAADHMNNGGIDKINNKPEYQKAADDGILMDLNHPITKKYMAEHDLAFHQAMIESWRDTGMNPSGTKKFEIQEVESPDGNYKDVFLVDVDRKVKHAETDAEPNTDFAFRLDRDPTGLVTKYVLVEGDLVAASTTERFGVNGRKVDDAPKVTLIKHEDVDDFLGGFLQHHGVKGMKWGVRTKDGSASQPTEVTVTQKKPGTRVRTSGGKNLPPSDDAVRVATARQKAQSSSTDALSNKELGDLVKRMQLEQQYGQIMAVRNQSVISKGYKAVKGLLGVADTANRAYNLQNTPLAQQLREELDKEK